MNDNYNVQDIELTPAQDAMCSNLARDLVLNGATTKDVIVLAMKLGIKSEQDFFE